MDRFTIFAKLLTSKSLPRSEAYVGGLAAELRYRVTGEKFVCLFASGEPEFDAFFAGVQHADLFLHCVNYGDAPDIDIRDAWDELLEEARIAA